MVLPQVFFGVATLGVAGRLLSRSKWFNGPGFWWDDWFVVFLWATSTSNVVLPIVTRGTGLGRDTMGDVTEEEVHSLLRMTYANFSLQQLKLVHPSQAAFFASG
jgi:hypothetical protein